MYINILNNRYIIIRLKSQALMVEGIEIVSPKKIQALWWNEWKLKNDNATKTGKPLIVDKKTPYDWHAHSSM